MYQLKLSCLLIHYSIPPQFIPLTIVLLEALCLISLLPSFRSLLGKDVLLINYHFYRTIHLLMLNNFLIHLNLQQRWKTICCQVDWFVWLWHQWLTTLTVDSNGASTLLARLKCILAPSSSMGVIFSFNFCFFFFIVFFLF